MYESYQTSKKDSLEEIHHLVDSSQVIKNNTFKIYYKDGSIAIRLHYTDVVTFYPDTIKLNAGNWLTHTTKSRINEHLPIAKVIQNKNIWYIHANNGKFLFYNGVLLDYHGFVLDNATGEVIYQCKDTIKEPGV